MEEDVAGLLDAVRLCICMYGDVLTSTLTAALPVSEIQISYE
jgi:hypothetical protein